MHRVKKISDRISEALNIKGIKPIELSQMTGINKSQISHYISGYCEPKQDNFYLIANALNVDYGWLMGYDVEKRNITIPIEKTKKDEVIQDIIEICKYQDEETLRTILTIVKSLDKRK